MGGLDKILLPDERIVAQARPHWIGFLPSFGHGSVALIVSGAAIPMAKDQRLPFFAAAGVFAALAVVAAIRAAVARLSCRYAVTNRRVITQIGLLSTRTVELMLFKVESLEVEQSLMGRVLGYGDLVLHGTGGQPTRMARVTDPHGLRNAVHAALEGSKRL